MAKRKSKLLNQVTTLLATTDPPLTQQEIADIVGCSSKTVQRVAKAIQPDVEELEERVKTYRALLHKELPLEYRAKRLKQLADQDQQMMVALKALERADAIDGLSRPPEEETLQERPPMFIMPPGTEIAVTVNLEKNNEGQRPQALQPTVINATATPVENGP